MAYSRFWLQIYILYGTFFLLRLSSDVTDLPALLMTALDDIYDPFSSINFIISSEKMYLMLWVIVVVGYWLIWNIVGVNYGGWVLFIIFWFVEVKMMKT